MKQPEENKYHPSNFIIFSQMLGKLFHKCGRKSFAIAGMFVVGYFVAVLLSSSPSSHVLNSRSVEKFDARNLSTSNKTLHTEPRRIIPSPTSRDMTTNANDIQHASHMIVHDSQDTRVTNELKNVVGTFASIQQSMFTLLQGLSFLTNTVNEHSQLLAGGSEAIDRQALNLKSRIATTATTSTTTKKTYPTAPPPSRANSFVESLGLGMCLDANGHFVFHYFCLNCKLFACIH